MASSPDGGPLSLQIRASYTACAESVFTHLATRFILRDKSIETFSWVFSEPRTKSTLPSWVPDMRFLLPNRNFVPPVRINTWASGDTEVAASIILSDSKLLICGRRVDIIDRVGSIDFKENQSEKVDLYSSDAQKIPKCWPLWRAECTGIAREAPHLEQDAELPDAFWRTLIWNCTDDILVRAPSVFLQGVKSFIEDYMDRAQIDFKSVTKKLESGQEVYLGHFKRSMVGARAGTLLFAMVPLATAPGDFICVLDGGCHPYVLRPCGDNEYRLVGACYLQGMMEGEAMEMAELEAETFTII
ncbi:hypothetical protein BDV96DRAFT_673666 [Lophiotrema nucula]|uniref:Heterokaryon incompatibility protein-domain-containing protein n=1 Tax=Lophiotrema nucula TaxID=690887 RepID=A0A6A5YM24_9PLEO|nr:hypothetical protein BDV96DRAFT_673666 [Lophiotrema nucula]